MQNGEKSLTASQAEAKYEVAYKDPVYHQASIGLAYLRWVLKNAQFNTVLDVGCGCGYSVCALMVEGKKVKGIEVCQQLLDTSLESYRVVGVVTKGRIQQIPYIAEAFDLVYCAEVLEHLIEEDVHQAIGELVRVSKKYVFVTVCFVPDSAIPGLHLHETVKNEEWWDAEFAKFRIRKVKGEPTAEFNGTQMKVRRTNGKAYLFVKY